MTSIARILAEFIAGTSYEMFPTQVIHQARRCLMDTVGVILAGSRYADSGQVIQKYAEKIREKEVATIIGTSMKRSVSTAALSNGVMAHALELDDGSKYATYHPGSSIIPTVLALAQEERVDGKALIEAIIMGYEVSLRIGTAINPAHYLRGFHPTGTIATFGTTAAASKILGLSTDQVTNALGLAGSLASGINQYEVDGSVVKHLHPGNAAQNGILAAKLAKEGFTGPEGVIDGRLGFCHCFADEYVTESITMNLKSEYDFLKIYFKPYCSCRYVHYAIEATQNILKEHPVSWCDVKSVNIRTHKNAKQCSDIPEYQTPLHARLSLQYGIASVLVRGTAGLKDYTHKSIRNADVRSVARKMTIEIDPDIQRLYPEPRSMIVEIIDYTGKKYSSRVDYAKGDPKNPISDTELKEKFKEVTSAVIRDEVGSEIINEAMKVEKWESVDHFMEMLQSYD